MQVYVLDDKMMTVGTVLRSENGTVRVVIEVVQIIGGRLAGKWSHKVRMATDEEKLASDVIQT